MAFIDPKDKKPISTNKRVIVILTISFLTLLFTAACGFTTIANTPQTISQTAPDVTETAPLPTVENTSTAIIANSATPTSKPANTQAPTLTPFPTSTATELPITPSPTMLLETATSTPHPTIQPVDPNQAPLPTPVGVYSWTLKVPILMYHYISIPPEDADKYRLDLSVSPEEFRTQMAYLAENGFQTIDLYDLSRAITAKEELPEKPVIITMDDGYRDNYENAFPILQEYGLKATFFVVSEFIDNNHGAYMSWDMIEEMAGAGMRIEPHSKTHADLSGQEKEYIIYEILGSQETIAAHIGYKPLYFCYPGGRYDETTLEVVEALNLWGAVTTAPGEWHGFDNRFEWERIRMRNTTAFGDFKYVVDPRDTIAGKYQE